MLGRLIIFILLSGLIWIAWRAWKEARARALPTIPDTWRALAARQEVLEHALDLWKRLLTVTRNAPERRVLLGDVHRAIASVADLVHHREELLEQVELLAADELPPDQAEQQAAALDAMRGRADRMEAEARHAVDGLRQVYLDLLTAHEQSAAEGRDAIRRTRETVAGIRTRVAAEQEIRELEQG